VPLRYDGLVLATAGLIVGAFMPLGAKEVADVN
jgi:hypothetical protein